MRQIEVLVRAIKDYDSHVIVGFHLQIQRVSFFGCLRIDQLNRRVIEGRTLVTVRLEFCCLSRQSPHIHGKSHHLSNGVIGVETNAAP